MARPACVTELEDRFKRMSQQRDGTLSRENYSITENVSGGLNGYYQHSRSSVSPHLFHAENAANSSAFPGQTYGSIGTDGYNSFRRSQRSRSCGDGRHSMSDWDLASSGAGYGESASHYDDRYSGAHNEMHANAFGHRSNDRYNDHPDGDSHSYMRCHPQLPRDTFSRDVVDDRDRLPTSPSRSLSHGSARPFDCRWVDDSEGCSNAVGDYRSVQDIAHERQCASPHHPLSQVRPSSFFIGLVEDVAVRRKVRAPPIPPEVSIAFDTFVSRGTTMLKFVSSGAPHKRFFVIKFLDNHKSYEQPQSVFCWYTNSHSWMMRRYLPLTYLVGVIRGWEDNPAVRKRISRHGLIKGSGINFRMSYLRPEYILQFQFCSFSGDEERIAVKFMSRESYVAWQIVAQFFCSIGFNGNFRT